YVVPGQNCTFENAHRQRVLNQALNGAAEWPGTISGIEALLEQQLHRRSCELQGDFALYKKLLDVLEQQIDDACQLFFAQRIEDNNLIDTIDEFRTECGAQGFHSFFAGALRILTRQLENRRRAN